jgi:hypothetical protein
MKVRELIKLLRTLNQDAVVVLSTDEEGNGFGPLEDYSVMKYDPETRECGFAELTPELKKVGYSEEDLGTGVDAIVLWP